jgi:ribonuclease HI
MQGHNMCNVDVGFHAQKEEHVLACVIETTWGCLYWQGALGSKGNAQQLKGEAAAMLEAMKELEQRGFTNVVFETDSKNVADAIHFMQFTHKTSNNVYFGF